MTVTQVALLIIATPALLTIGAGLEFVVFGFVFALLKKLVG